MQGCRARLPPALPDAGVRVSVVVAEAAEPRVSEEGETLAWNAGVTVNCTAALPYSAPGEVGTTIAYVPGGVAAVVLIVTVDVFEEEGLMETAPGL